MTAKAPEVGDDPSEDAAIEWDADIFSTLAGSSMNLHLCATLTMGHWVLYEQAMREEVRRALGSASAEMVPLAIAAFTDLPTARAAAVATS